MGVTDVVRDTLNGTLIANLANGTSVTICPSAGFRAAPPCVRSVVIIILFVLAILA